MFPISNKKKKIKIFQIKINFSSSSLPTATTFNNINFKSNKPIVSSSNYSFLLQKPKPKPKQKPKQKCNIILRKTLTEMNCCCSDNLVFQSVAFSGKCIGVKKIVALFCLKLSLIF